MDSLKIQTILNPTSFSSFCSWGVALLGSFALVLVLGCEEQRKRPIGFHRLGKIDQFLSPETEIITHRLLLRRDQAGLSAMSLMCSHDLDTLKADQAGYRCDLCGSKFDKNGKVLAAPAKVDLPYYSMLVDAETVGAPRDTVYVKVGDEVPPEWRLKLHFVDQ